MMPNGTPRILHPILLVVFIVPFFLIYFHFFIEVVLF